MCVIDAVENVKKASVGDTLSRAAAASTTTTEGGVRRTKRLRVFTPPGELLVKRPVHPHLHLPTRNPATRVMTPRVGGFSGSKSAHRCLERRFCERRGNGAVRVCSSLWFFPCNMPILHSNQQSSNTHLFRSVCEQHKKQGARSINPPSQHHQSCPPSGSPCARGARHLSSASSRT